MAVIENNKEMVPFEHYLALFKNINTEEAAQRCNVKFDSEKGCFCMRLLYEDYRVYWPEYRIESDNAGAFALKNIPAQILLIRYLLEGKHSTGSGAFLLNGSHAAVVILVH